MKRLSIIALAAWCGLAVSAQAASTADTRAACGARADAKSLAGKPRDEFMATCQQGALAPAKPTSPTPPAPTARAITAPSGADRTVRSRECTAEAKRRGLPDTQKKAFRLSCLASAAPVSTIGSPEQAQRPVAEKPELGVSPH